MQGLTTDLLGRACRIFINLAYPDGDHTVPPARATFLHLDHGFELDDVLQPPICQTLVTDGQFRGYALRLGCLHYPHLKLQVVDCDHSHTWVFAVDTHDGAHIDPGGKDAAKWTDVQAKNRRLKEEIELAWEASGLLTFHALLRRGLDCGPGSPEPTGVTSTPTVAFKAHSP